jgi:hypothetical protein
MGRPFLDCKGKWYLRSANARFWFFNGLRVGKFSENGLESIGLMLSLYKVKKGCFVSLMSA